MQPRNLLYQYLVDLMEEPGGGKMPAGEPAGNRDTMEPAATTAAVAVELERSPTVPGAEQDAGDPLTGECAEGRFTASERREAVAVSPEIPEWAEAPFQVLMIRVRGVNLGVPLHYLDSIVRWNGQATSIPGQPGWQPGLYLHKAQSVALVNLARLIMPERDLASGAASSGYLLLVGHSRWGLICDAIQRPRLLRAADVRWCRSRQFRSWSHGIIIGDLCVLLNINALLELMGTNDA